VKGGLYARIPAIVIGCLTVFLSLIAGETILDMAHVTMLAGPNTNGEAGKVYLAQQFQRQGSVCNPADEPPFYPSTHGILLFAIVGWLGKLTDNPVVSLFYIGRTISILATIAGLIASNAILRATGVGVTVRCILGVTLFSLPAVLEHTTSYRPDNWVFAISTISCAALCGPGARSMRLPVLLAFAPPLAYLFKSNGVSLVIPIAVALLVVRRDHHAALVFLVSTTLLEASVLAALQLSTGGAYLASLTTGLQVPYSFANIGVCLSPLPVQIVLLAALALTASSPMSLKNPRVATVAIFFLSTLVSAAISCVRSGSNSYYFLEPVVYGLLLAGSIATGGAARTRTAWRTIGAVLVLVLVCLGVHYENSRAQPIFLRNLSVIQAQQHAAHRRTLADIINKTGMRCLSDDAGLNILLNRPEVIEMYLPSQMMKAGTLSNEAFAGALQRREVDVVILTGDTVHFQGVHSPPDTLFTALRRNYVLLSRRGGYRIFRPRTDQPELDADGPARLR
jgi:hypothetical protein